MSTVNTAIIGFGLSGSVFHAPIISSTEGFHLKTIYTANPERQSRVRALYPDAAAVSDVNEIFKDDSIQLVVVTSLNAHHYELAEKAILAGKNVVVEKPFTIASSDADKLIELAEKKNVVLSVF